MKLKNKIIENERIILSEDAVNVLGPNLVLRDCEIISEINNHRALIVAGVEMIGGSFYQKGTLSDEQWDTAIFTKVKFKGKLSGWDFGNWDEPDYINECDFSDAVLSDCRFLNCDISQLIFPKWPCFTIPAPSSKADQISKISWTGNWKLTMRLYAENDKECVAITGNVDDLIAENGGDKEDLKRKLSTIPGIIM